MGIGSLVAKLLGRDITGVRRKVSFHDQLETFRTLGFDLNEGVEIADVDRWGGPAAFEEQPFSLLYVTLGQTLEREPWTPMTDRCWTFDTEAIEDHGSYIEIMRNLERIARGALQFADLQDYVDIEEGQAWVSFTVGGNNYKWELKVQDDWVDPTLFSRLVKAIKTLTVDGRFTYFNTGGQNAVIGFETRSSREQLISRTGLQIEWLS